MWPLLGAGAAALARAGAGAAAGVGIGAGSNYLFGDGDYEARDAVQDGALGAFGLGRLAGRGLSGMGFTSLAPRTTLGGWAKGTLPGFNRAGGWMSGMGTMSRLGASGAIPLQAGRSSTPVGMIQPFDILGALGGRQEPVQGSQVPRETSGGTGIGGNIEGMLSGFTVNPVAINYQQGAAPVFNKTLKDYLADKQLQGLVNQNIFATNKPILTANEKEKTSRARNVEQNRQVGASLQKEIDAKIVSHAADQAAAEARAQARQALLKAETEIAEAAVPITYLEGEAVKAKADAQVAAANEDTLADALIDRLAQAGDQYIKGLKSADASQTQVNEQAINQKAHDAIRANAAQIRANQAQRGSLLGTLAAEQYGRAIDLHNLAMDQYNNTENRRFTQAQSEAEMKFNARRANAEARANMLGALMDAEAEAAKDAAKPSKDPDKAAARKRMDKINDEISKVKTTMVEVQGEQVPYASTPAGKKEIEMKRHERDRLREKYGL